MPGDEPPVSVESLIIIVKNEDFLNIRRDLQ